MNLKVAETLHTLSVFSETLKKLQLTLFDNDNEANNISLELCVPLFIVCSLSVTELQDVVHVAPLIFEALRNQ